VFAVGANAGKSKMNFPPPASNDCVAGFTTRSPRLMATAVIGFREPATGVMPSVIRVRCASP
jgi:hypothetical protein